MAVIEIIESASGYSLYINDYRVAGPKPVPYGNKTVAKWRVDAKTISAGLGRKAA